MRPWKTRSITSALTAVVTGVWEYAGWKIAVEPLKGLAVIELLRFSALAASRARAFARFSSRAAEYSAVIASPAAAVSEPAAISFCV